MKVECLKCGDCCRTADGPEVNLASLEQLVQGWGSVGYWYMDKSGTFHLYEPFLNKMIDVDFDLSENLIEFWSTWSDRLSGLWVSRTDLISPNILFLRIIVPCRHLMENGLCDIYDDRPAECRKHFCERFSVDSQ